MNNPVAEKLRDIHLPDPVGFWPLAIGWYFLAALLLLLIGLSVGYAIYRRRRLKAQRYLLTRIELLRKDYQQKSDAKVVAVELSILLRRAALVSYPRYQVAGLQGEQWLKFLDKIGQTQEFSQGVGRILLTAPYQNQPEFDVDSLFALVIRWAGMISDA
jgi:hypothetical protein